MTQLQPQALNLKAVLDIRDAEFALIKHHSAHHTVWALCIKYGVILMSILKNTQKCASVYHQSVETLKPEIASTSVYGSVEAEVYMCK